MTVSVNYEFRNELIQKNFSLTNCYQCSTCSSGCPIAFLTEGKYNPRIIIEEALLGLKDQLINENDFTIFLCSTCHKCVELCPQGTELVEIFNTIKNYSASRGILPKAFKIQAKNIINEGVAIPLSSAIQRRREKMGIPNPVFADPKEIQIIIKTTGLDKILNIVLEDSNKEKVE
ncbi:MAG: 4Fe-4S dicluster domain-containing protein [Candidatus Helarchaeota archaeon]